MACVSTSSSVLISDIFGLVEIRWGKNAGRSLLATGRWVLNQTRKSPEILQNGYSGAMTRPCFSFGPFLLDSNRRVLLRHNKPVAAGQRAVAILDMLLMHAGDV